jgi:proteasome lid subunit RPN8/RPN11
MTLRLASDQVSAIRREAERAYPRECCGVLVGRDEPDGRRVSEVVVVQNDFESSQQTHRFSIPPLRLLELEKRSGEAGGCVLGFFHSHPDAEAVPSGFDLEHAWPFYSYVIVSVRQGRSEAMRSWVLDESGGAFVEQAIAADADAPRQRRRLGRGCR